jgi:hypothetical protein
VVSWTELALSQKLPGLVFPKVAAPSVHETPRNSSTKLWKVSLMAMFTAYFDASGAPDDPNVKSLTVAGFLASADQWIIFDRRWRKVLKKYGVTALHMREFAHSKGEFEGWDKEPKKEKRAFFIGELVTILQRLMRCSFACTLSLNDYRKNEGRYKIRKVASPLAIAGLMAVGDLVAVAKDMQQPLDKLLLMFEDGDIDKGNLEDWIKGVFALKTHFEDKTIKAFEACDLLAYEHLQASNKLLPAPGVYALEDLRKAFQRLDVIPHALNGHDHWSFIANPKLEESTKKMLASSRRPGVERYPVTVLCSPNPPSET